MTEDGDILINDEDNDSGVSSHDKCFLFQINCRLFLFDVSNHSWREKGRGFLRLNDMCKSSSDGTFQSRLGEFFQINIT